MIHLERRTWIAPNAHGTPPPSTRSFSRFMLRLESFHRWFRTSGASAAREHPCTAIVCRCSSRTKLDEVNRRKEKKRGEFWSLVTARLRVFVNCATMYTHVMISGRDKFLFSLGSIPKFKNAWKGLIGKWDVLKKLKGRFIIRPKLTTQFRTFSSFAFSSRFFPSTQFTWTNI